MNPPPSSSARVLGVVGIVGGLALISAFLPVTIPDDLNTLRLALFNVGAMAVALGVFRTAGVERRGLRAIAAAVVVTNAWHLVMTVVAMTLERPFAGDYGLVFFWAGMAMWLADSALGFALVRGVGFRPWGPLALGVGSLLAILGMDRLGLTSAANQTAFGQVALIGVFLNGMGWILLGIELAIRDRSEPTGRHSA